MTFDLGAWRIRPVTLRDAQSWITLRGELWPAASSVNLEREVSEFFSGVRGIVDAAFLAETQAGEAIGFLELSLRAYSPGCASSPVPHVEGWYVRSDFRRRGIASRLMGSAQTWASDRGYRELGSESREHDEGGHAAHRALGFSESARLVSYRKVIDSV